MFMLMWMQRISMDTIFLKLIKTTDQERYHLEKNKPDLNYSNLKNLMKKLLKSIWCI